MNLQCVLYRMLTFNFITACIMAVCSIIIGYTESNIDVTPAENNSVIKELSEGEQAVT